MPRAVYNERYFNETWFNAPPNPDVPLSMSGAITPTGANLKQTSKNLLAGAITPTGAFTKIAKLIPSGVITPAGAVTRNIWKSFAGAITPAGAVLKKTTLSVFTGAITPIGTGLANKVSGVIYYVTCTGALAATGALTSLRTSIVACAGAIAPTGALVKQTIKYLSGAVTSSGWLQAKPLASVVNYVICTGVITMSGALSRVPTFVKVLTGAMTPAGALLKQTHKYLSGAITPTGALSGPISQYLRPPFRAVIAIARLVAGLATRRTKVDL